MKDKVIKIIPIGGLGEVGRNCLLLCLENDWIIIDAGIGFPFNEYPGVEIILPNSSYLKENSDKIKALIISHAHEDHLGSAIQLLSELNIPNVIGSKLALSIIESRIKNSSIKINPKFSKVSPKDVFNVGGIKMEFIRSTHSVPDSFCIFISSCAGNIFFTGDFKFDFTPIDNEYFDIQRIVELSKEGIDLLISDSTNIERQGFSLSERTVGQNISNIFKKTKKRIFITTFSSHLHRIQQILDAALATKKKVCILGYSLELFFSVAKDTGYLKYPENLLLKLNDILKLPEDKIVIITSGSQGEIYSVLSRLSKNDYKSLSIIPGDTIIFSANPIPGNERAVSKLLDKLCLLGADLIYGRNENIHVSGHAAQEELKLMIALTRPKYFLPVHGDYRMLVQHAELAASMGIDPTNIYLIENGDILEFNKNCINVQKNQIVVNPVYMDTIGDGILDEKSINDRLTLSNDGIVIVFVTLNNEIACINAIDIIVKGVSYINNASENTFVNNVKTEIEKSFERIKKFGNADAANIKTISRDITSKLIEKSIGSKPLTMILTQDINPNNVKN